MAFGFDKPLFFFFFFCLEAVCSLGTNTETGNCNSLLVASSKEGLRSSFSAVARLDVWNQSSEKRGKGGGKRRVKKKAP